MAAFPPPPALQCSKFKALVLSLFSHYLLFDQKSGVYEAHASGALSGRASGAALEEECGS
jgi:hypothetical protein